MTVFIATVVAVTFTRLWRFHFCHSHNNSVIFDDAIAIAVVELSRSCQWQYVERSQQDNSGDFLWRKVFFDWEIPHHKLWATIRYFQNWNYGLPRSVLWLGHSPAVRFSQIAVYLKKENISDFFPNWRDENCKSQKNSVRDDGLLISEINIGIRRIIRNLPWTSSVKEGRMVEREGAGMDGEERAGGEESRMQVAIKYILEVFSEVSTWVFLTERPLVFAFHS